MKTRTLITGASSGIGMHMAHEFAGRGHHLILVAPVAAELDRVAADLRQSYSIEVETYAIDLEHPEEIDHLGRNVESRGLTVEILCNNAGHGQKGNTWEISQERELSIVRLNIEALLRMTRIFLPPMIQRGQGRILNTASVAGFMAGPSLNVYHASKAFVLSYTEGLAVELEGSGVSVTALCPGPTDTDFFPKADMLDTQVFHKGNLMAPQDVAKAGVEACLDGELLVIPGVSNKMLIESRRAMTEHAQAKLSEKFYKGIPPAKQSRERGDKELSSQ